MTKRSSMAANRGARRLVAALTLVGALGISAAPAGAATVSRLSGDDRYLTAAAISRAAFIPGVPAAYVATGLDFPDALAAAPAAARDRSPILLVETDRIPLATMDELRRLRPGRIVVVGGTAAVSQNVESQLAAFTAGTVTRLAGDDRFGTAARISAATATPGDPVFIAPGTSFADAIAAGAVGVPLLLVAPNAIPQVTADELNRLRPRAISVVGGPAVVSEAVETTLGTYTTGPVTRRAGLDRYATSVAVSNSTYQPGTATVFVATGTNFPDALAGGPMAATVRGPLLLVPGSCVPATVNAEIDRLNPTNLVILGGETALSPAVESRTPCTPPAPQCLASVSDPAPQPGGSQTVRVRSNLPNSPVLVTARYATTNPTYTGQTDTAGAANVTFVTGSATSGVPVRVDVRVADQASCQTTFTPR